MTTDVRNIDETIAEESIAAWMLLWPDKMELARVTLTPEDFDDSMAAEIFDIARAIPVGQDVRAAVLRAFQRNGKLDELNRYLLGLFEKHQFRFFSSYIDYYVTTLRQRTHNRKVQAELSAVLNSENPTDEWRSAVARINELSSGSSNAPLVRDYINEIVERAQSPGERLRFGMPELDDCTGGGCPRQTMALVCAPTGGGKSAFLMNFAIPNLDDGRSGVWFSLEMGRSEIHSRLVAYSAELPLSVVRDAPSMNKEQRSRYASATAQIANWKLHIVDEPGLPIEDAFGVCYRHKQRHGLDFVLLDYIGLFGTHERIKERHEKLGWIAQRAHDLAMELDCVVFAAHQLSRDGAKKERPSLNDIEGSSKIANAMDLVLLLNPKEAFAGVTEVELFGDKVRWDEKFSARMKFIGKYQKFIPANYNSNFDNGGF